MLVPSYVGNFVREGARDIVYGLGDGWGDGLLMRHS